MPTLVQLEELTKGFPGVLANKHINLEVKRGEVHALLGENGAGKTTLMNTLYGLLTPDEGRIHWEGQPVLIQSPRDAIRLGIGMVHQHFMLVPPLTVLENVVLGLHHGLASRMAEAERRLTDLAGEFGLHVSPHTRIEQLSVGAQQRVEILKALYRDVQLLILDEPTAVLTPQEAELLFRVCRALVMRGRSVIFITHKLDEVMALSDRVTVLRDGEIVGTVETSQTTKRELARMMVGREVLMNLPRTPQAAGDIVLALEHVSVPGERAALAVKNASFSVREGEIVGVAGVDGNGQQELVEAVLGLRKTEGGRIFIRDEQIPHHTPRTALNRGVVSIPADRQSEGLATELNIEENAILDLAGQPRFSVGGFLRSKELTRFANELIRGYDVRAVSTKTQVKFLSGGNQQRLVVGRAIAHRPRLLVAVQPTRGLDIASTEFVRNELLKLRQEGKAILLVSTDLEEVLGLSDRVEVIFEGRIMGSLSPDAGREDIGLMMAGVGSGTQEPGP